MRAIVIKSPWIEKILAGEKTWEIRSRRANIRGTIGLIKSGSGTVVGVCKLVDCIGPLTDEVFVRHVGKHRVTRPMREIGYDSVYAWVFESARTLNPPVRYNHPSGAVIWVTLEEAVERSIRG